jgi:hypothetical protein
VLLQWGSTFFVELSLPNRLLYENQMIDNGYLDEEALVNRTRFAKALLFGSHNLDAAWTFSHQTVGHIDQATEYLSCWVSNKKD